MIYVNYNDNELLYLIKEGSERAFNVLYQKYYVLIRTIAKKYYRYGDKYYDLVQEGLMIFDKCVKHFTKYIPASFYTYVQVSLKRRFDRLVYKGNYFDKLIYFNENIGKYNDLNYIDNTIQIVSKRLLDTEIDILIYEECIIGNSTLKTISDIYNIDYNWAQRKRKEMLEKMKKALTIEEK